MSQEIRTQVFESTTTAGGNLTFPGVGLFYPTEHLTGLLINLEVTSASPASVQTLTKRKDGSVMSVFFLAAPALGGHWEMSLGDYMMANPLTSAITAPIFLPPFVQLVIAGATTSTVRVTVWSIKLTG